jgi:hypothetical protein
MGPRSGPWISPSTVLRHAMPHPKRCHDQSLRSGRRRRPTPTPTTYAQPRDLDDQQTKRARIVQGRQRCAAFDQHHPLHLHQDNDGQQRQYSTDSRAHCSWAIGNRYWGDLDQHAEQAGNLHKRTITHVPQCFCRSFCSEPNPAALLDVGCSISANEESWWRQWKSIRRAVCGKYMACCGSILGPGDTCDDVLETLRGIACVQIVYNHGDGLIYVGRQQFSCDMFQGLLRSMLYITLSSTYMASELLQTLHTSM